MRNKNDKLNLYSICVEFIDNDNTSTIVTIVDTDNKAAYDRAVKMMSESNLKPTGQVYKNERINNIDFHSALSAFRVAAKIFSTRIERALRAFNEPVR